MYEEWAWDSEVLSGFATHHETGEPIPAEMIVRMRAAEEYGKGMHVMQQMFYARLSLAYYNRDPGGVDVTADMVALKQEMLPTPHTEGTYFSASFGHLHGYSAMYYTYMWSLVIAKDLFTRFESDLMSTATANDYRAAVLGPGGSKDARELVSDFLGREYAFDAFETWLTR
jgi:thimet oligopeptidase